MPVSTDSYGGRLGFLARVYLPKLSFLGYSILQTIKSKKISLQYMRQCIELKQNYRPIIVNIETINRCNGRCSFCPANVKDEQRPYKKMSDELFNKIINELADIDYRGIISLYVNNEPFMDKRMPDLLKKVRSSLPDSTVFMSTNGTSLTAEILNEIAECVDTMFVNNYNKSYELTESSKFIIGHIKQNEALFKNINVVIKRRYNKEYLTNRAGTAPNKVAQSKVMNIPCIMPFTDFTVFPDGIVGLCCNDCLEKTNFGDLKSQGLMEIFNSVQLKELREKMYQSRSNISFCKHCDLVDADFRLDYIKRNP